MRKEEISSIPSGMIFCSIILKENIYNNKRIDSSIVNISPFSIDLRIDEDYMDFVSNDNISLVVSFFNFEKSSYDDVYIESILNKEIIKKDFYIICKMDIDNNDYMNNVRRITIDYSKYIKIKNFGDDFEFSKEMVNYPSYLEYDYYDSFEEQKLDWINDVTYCNWNDDIVSDIEIAVSLNNDYLYDLFLHRSFSDFLKYYYEKNNFCNHELAKRSVGRVYVGSEVCHNLFPDKKKLFNIMDKCNKEGIDITICFTYLIDSKIDDMRDLSSEIYDWCLRNKKKIEVVINDYGMIEMFKEKYDYIDMCFGTLLNKRRKDPRINYKQGIHKYKDIMKLNGINGKSMNDFLSNLKINRYEYDGCGYDFQVSNMKNSLHIPFYVTNVSQYCPLYAMCTNCDRGHQKLVYRCPKYCSNYVFSYPKHLKMVGRYNSLFAFDDTFIKDGLKLDEYVLSGVDRVVFNFI